MEEHSPAEQQQPDIVTSMSFPVLNPPKEKAMTVQFNAVVQLDHWDMETRDTSEAIYIRFGCSQLGDWKDDVGPCHLRDTGLGYYAVEYNVTINYEFVRSQCEQAGGIPYKYVIYSPTMPSAYEFLHGVPRIWYRGVSRDKCCRLLKVPCEFSKLQGTYRKFDTMILPNIDAATDPCLSGLPRMNDPNNIVVLSSAKMRSKCTEVYLQPHKEYFIRGNFSQYHNSIHTGIAELVSLFHTTFNQVINCEGEELPWPVDKIGQHVKDVFQSFFCDVKITLQPDSDYFVASGIILSCAFYKLLSSYKIDIKNNFRIKLIELMTLSTKKGESQFGYLLKMMKTPDTKQVILTALQFFVRSMHKPSVDDALIILKVLPLYHFLLDFSVPQQFCQIPLQNCFIECPQFLCSLQDSMILKSGFLTSDSCADINELLSFDSRLRYVLPYICPEKDTVILCQILPLEIAIVWLTQTFRKDTKLPSISANRMESCFKNPVSCIQNRLLNRQEIADFSVYLDAISIVKGSFLKKLDGCNNAKIIVTSIISIYLCILHKYNVCESEDIIEAVKTILNEWVTNPSVIGGQTFGESIKNGKLCKEDEELKLWSSVLSATFSSTFPNEEVEEMFHQVVASCVNCRVSKIQALILKFDLLINVESQKGIPDLLKALILKQATEALDYMLANEMVNSIPNIHRQSQLASLKSECVMDLFAKIITSKYSTKEISFIELLEWNLWPWFIKIFAKKWTSDKTNSLRRIVKQVVQTFEEVCTSIRDGNVIVANLQKIQDNEVQMKDLYQSVNQTRLYGFEKIIQQRLRELQYFNAYRTKLITFLAHIGDKLDCYFDLQRELEYSFEDCKLNTLVCQAVSSNENYQILCFQIVQNSDFFVDDFCTVSVSHIFIQFWQEQLRKRPITIKMSCNEVNEFVWRPVIQSCFDLIDGLKSGDITLSTINSLFKGIYTNNYDLLHNHVKVLDGAISSIRKHSQNHGWIKNRVKQVVQYLELCSYQEAAQTFISVRDTLKLTGDFKLFHNIVAQADDRTLNLFDYKITKAAKKFLTPYVTDVKKKECLNALARCRKIIQWIKKETRNDIKHLRDFVTVAIGTAASEQGDFAVDKLCHLETILSAFSPLICVLPQCADYKMLHDHCKELWETLQHNPNLPNIIETCNEEVEWFQSIKASLGSVETTSYGQMKTINANGTFMIGSSQKRILMNQSEGICVKVEQPDRPGVKLRYTLDELKDLESKLVLITGSNSEDRDNVEFYSQILNSSCRIVDVLIALQKHGNDNYIGWNLSFPASMNDAVNALQTQASLMEKHLEKWQYELSINRDRFYELNYFTNCQILFLREKLCEFESGTIHSPQDVLTLLQCISMQIQHVNVNFESLEETMYGKMNLVEFESASDNESDVPSSNSSSLLLFQLDCEQQLTNKQKSIMTNIRESHGFSTRLILYAFRKCTDPFVEESVLECCLKNREKTFQYSSCSSLSVIEGVIDDEESDLYLQKEMPQEVSDFPQGFMFQSRSDTLAKCYCTIEKLGKALCSLTKWNKATVSTKRSFPKGLQSGEINLLISPKDKILKTVLSIYMEDVDFPLPTHEEVLICNENTTDEEVTLLWRRALGDPQNLRIFCLVHAEKLSYKVCDTALKTLMEHSHSRKDYKLVIVCTDNSYWSSKLNFCRRQLETLHLDQDYRNYLHFHFTRKSRKNQDITEKDSFRVMVVTSQRAGMGKSLYVQRMKDKFLSRSDTIVIPVHGPMVTNDTVVHSFKQSSVCDKSTNFIHLDFSSNVLHQVDSILFSLLILQAVSDSQGRIWRCYPSDMYVIEVTVSEKDRILNKSTVALLNLLPSFECLSPCKGTKTYDIPVVDEEEYRTPQFQRVCQYLVKQKREHSLDKFCYKPHTIFKDRAEGLDVILKQCGVRDPSWSELNHFIQFLNTQLEACENSAFCDELVAGDTFPGLKTFVTNFMIRMSKDFATSSLRGEVHVAAENQDNIVDDLEEYQIDQRKLWEQNYHPYLFFNKDRTSITFVGFNVTREGTIRDPVKNENIDGVAMTPELYVGLWRNKVNLSENYSSWDKDTMINKIGMVMGYENASDPDPTYVLTVDNVIKIMAIHMRFRCSIPVVIMGETGCGKTRLIRYMCDLAAEGCKGGKCEKNMLLLKVHGGTSENDIMRVVEEAESISSSNTKKHNIDTVVFFDEANTSDAIGLIKEVMCDRRINGRPIKADIKFIAACNPYRKHTDRMIQKLESAGLGFFVRAVDTQEKLGKIPLRQLVYRVLDLPPSMKPLVYDFGQLNSANDESYTIKIVEDRCSRIPDIRRRSTVINLIAQVLVRCQRYMRKRVDECSFVSLRDVERAMIVFRYFYHMKHHFGVKVEEKARIEKKSPVDAPYKRALILAVSVCYHARLQKRKNFERQIPNLFHLYQLTEELFLNEIRWCQEVLLDNMKLGPNIARNTALRENAFMMAICIELKIPLFLVGKPGSSKSLAKAVVANSMLGRASEKEMMKQMKEVHMFSYQCSQLSTSESVIEVFNTAKSFQEKQNVKSYVSVVVLDEIGLAEDSPNLPLKALHPLLEDGTEGQDKIPHDRRVAFIGISNWALDPAKMNRGIMVTRGDPDEEELIVSARGICSNKFDDPVRQMLEIYFKPLADAYKYVCKNQRRAFFGLRDFYSLIKMLYWMCEKSKCPPTKPQLEHAIKRNFGGYEDINTYEVFLEHLPKFGYYTPCEHDDEKLFIPDCSPLGLIRKSLQTKETSWHGENRYLLFITENNAALHIIRHYLREDIGMKHKSGLEEVSATACHEMEPYVLFGSSFPKDKEYTQVCRNINQIKICMETGRTVILLNLEKLYESLYDLLNQYYTHLGDGQRYVDLGLQTHRVKCRVHDDFKLIMIAERRTVYEKFPIPLINRLEKHFVLTETVIQENWQKEVYFKLTDWVNQFTTIQQTDTEFTKQDAFVGYQNDTPSSVMFQAIEQLHIKDEWKNISEEFHNDEKWKKELLIHSKKALLQMATPDALIRLQNSSLSEDECKELRFVYFTEQCHGSIIQLLKHHFDASRDNRTDLLLQVTTHGQILSNAEIIELCQNVGLDESNVSYYLLQEFDTEIDFHNKVSPFFTQNSKHDDSLLILQCDSGHLYHNLLACAHYYIDEMRVKATHLTKTNITRVLFIISLPRHQSEDMTSLSFIGFQGGDWVSAHIDDVTPTPESVPSLNEALSASISKLFYDGEFFNTTDKIVFNGALKSGHMQRCHLRSCIQTTVAKIIETNDAIKTQYGGTAYIRLLLQLIPKNLISPLDCQAFSGALIRHIKNLLEERGKHMNLSDKSWVLQEALSIGKLHNGGTFHNVLTRKLDEVIVPMFTAILQFINQYANLNILNKNEPTYREFIEQLWIAIFNNDGLVQFNYEKYRAGGDIGYHAPDGSKIPFKCQFPFFWLIKEAIESKWKAKGISGTDDLHSQLAVQLADTPLVSVLSRVPKEYWRELYLLYLEDFLKSVHHVPHHKFEDEYEILKKSLDAVIGGCEFNRDSFFSYLIAVHVLYHEYEHDIMWFGQLTTHIPGILVHLTKEEEYSHSIHMTLSLNAVEIAINTEIALPLNREDCQYIPQRLIKLQLCQNAIDSILSRSITPRKRTLEIRCEWQHVRAVQMFFEHIIVKFISDENILVQLVCFAKMMDESLEEDFSSVKTFREVQTVLQKLDDFCRTTYPEDLQRLIHVHCKSYFMEVVSSLCFGQETLPEPALIKELLNVVFADNYKTKDLSYSEKDESDKVPVIRSFLLQLLLDHNTEKVKEHLEDYFERSRQLICNDRTLCLLCMQCLEDAVYKKHIKIGLQERINISCDYLNPENALVSSVLTHSPSKVTIPYLDSLAKIRYALIVTAEVLHYHYDSDEKSTCDTTILLKRAKLFCSKSEIGSEFLLKQISRQYGHSFLTNLTSKPGMEWIVPPKLRQSKKESQQNHDPFVMYNSKSGNSYSVFRVCINDAVYGGNIDKLNTALETLHANNSVPVLLGVYQIITGSATYTAQAKIIPDDTRVQVLKFVRRCPVLNRKHQLMAQHLIESTYCGRLEPMLLKPGMSQQNRLLTDLVIHSAASLQYKSIAPFVQIVNKPEQLKNLFLPTMPEDALPTIRKTLSQGKFYECPNGHRYFVSECGKPMQNSKCPTCNVPIGGERHKLHSTNKVASTSDNTETGYILGTADQRELDSLPERSLSPPSCVIIRALMHCVLLWSSCSNENAIRHLLDLIKHKVRSTELSLFFWKHLEHDISLLSKVLGKSKDDACLVIHLVLKDIVIKENALAHYSLLTKDERSIWEKRFDQTYIQPILMNLDGNLSKVTEAQLRDQTEDRDKLFYIIHEKVAIPPEAIVPHLWTYRSRITLEHLFQVLQAKKDTCPILHDFLKNETLLRATQYLPGIVSLQQEMYEMSHRKLDKKEVEKITIGKYISRLNGQRQGIFRENLKCVQQAWRLVKDKLEEHARVSVPVDLLRAVKWDNSTSLANLVPTLNGPGVCTVALTDLLVGIHNEFVEKSRSQLKKKLKERELWKEYKIPLSNVQICHVFNYEHQLLSVVLSHCHYSLEYGKGQNVSYDLPALEKHIVNRFMHGKPLIQLEIPQVAYRKDVYNVETFANIRRNVYPQIKLDAKQQTDILKELHSIQRLRECLDVVEIVISFLSSGESSATTELGMFVKKVLKMENKFRSRKALEYCTLGHILSLWETLSLRMTKILIIGKKEPFDSLGKDLNRKFGGQQQIRELWKFVKGIDVPTFVALLHEFIETYVRHTEPHEMKWPLRDTLYAHLEQIEMENELPHDFCTIFPETIRIYIGTSHSYV